VDTIQIVLRGFCAFAAPACVYWKSNPPIHVANVLGGVGAGFVGLAFFMDQGMASYQQRRADAAKATVTVTRSATVETTPEVQP
jgi:hypothetical protein